MTLVPWTSITVVPYQELWSQLKENPDDAELRHRYTYYSTMGKLHARDSIPSQIGFRKSTAKLCTLRLAT